MRFGASEANPLLGFVEHPAGMVAFTVIKVGYPLVVHNLPEEICRPIIAWSTGIGFGAAIHNLVVIAGLGGAAPIGIGVGLMSTIISFKTNANSECQPTDRLGD